ncbi:hypothetical protein RHSIM_Rhsim01G0275200 [Rhododendron simsii]|uniref:Gnk2-homologous domain-containing protein n=1 Tax=Rhododendron simsii TaxID=118357 RepID=A0A834LYD4_RHOSS|nr:hypothetical protein RHSIM_Rhsim01G0275200 [Rhododendron simsii]
MAFLLKMKVLVTALLIGFLGLSGTVQCNPNTNRSNVLCNSRVFSDGNPFTTSLAYVLSELETVMPTRQVYDYYNISPYPNAFAYGHAACNTSLTSPDCSTCLGAAKTALFGTCLCQPDI